MEEGTTQASADSASDENFCGDSGYASLDRIEANHSSDRIASSHSLPGLIKISLGRCVWATGSNSRLDDPGSGYRHPSSDRAPVDLRHVYTTTAASP